MIRVSPNPTPWNEVFQRLKQFAEARGVVIPPPTPLILNGWVFSNDCEKKSRWESTVEWAKNAGCQDLLLEIADSDFYCVDELSTYTVGPMGGPMYRAWDFKEKDRLEIEAVKMALGTLKRDWCNIVKELAEITYPLGFSGAKLRRLIVSVTGEGLPPWGGWTYLSHNEDMRRTFTKLRAAVNEAIKPHEVDHIDFIENK